MSNTCDISLYYHRAGIVIPHVHCGIVDRRCKNNMLYAYNTTLSFGTYVCIPEDY